MRGRTLDFTRRRRLPVVLAAESAECGLACLAMIAGYHRHDVDLNGLRHRQPLSLTGLTLRQLTELAGELGFSTRAVRIELQDLPRVAGPAILHWDLSHFVVLRHADKSSVTIHDPARGARKLSMNEVSLHFTGVALELVPRPDLSIISARSPMRLGDLFSELIGEKEAFLHVLALTAALQGTVFASPFLLQLVVDQAVLRTDDNLVLTLALGFGGLALLHATIEALRSWSLKVFGLQASFQLVGNLVGHLLRLPSPWFEKRHVGDIMSRIGSANTIQDTLTRGVVEAALDGAMAVAAGGLLFVYSPLLACVVFASVALVLALNLTLVPGMRRRSQERIAASAKEQSQLMESVRAFQTIKVMGREAEREGRWRNHYADVVNGWGSLAKFEITAAFIRSLVSGVQTVVIVAIGAHLILAAEGFSIGMLFAFLAFRQIFTDRALALIEQGVQFRLLGLHLDRLSDIVHAAPDPTVTTPLETLAGGIVLSGVSFRYGVTDRLILEDIHIDVSPGEFIAISGPSGGGKTTLLKLLTGLQAPSAGSILLDGIPATPELWRSWRHHLGLVAQDDKLLSGTIAENISFFDPYLDMAKVQAAATKARLHADILALPMQYSSLIGDMGSALSGGQRQRLLLARALYRNPKILILDEGTANLDPVTEAEIVELVAGMNITRIVVAHRPALIERADRVLLVEHGSVMTATHPTLRQ